MASQRLDPNTGEFDLNTFLSRGTTTHLILLTIGGCQRPLSSFEDANLDSHHLLDYSYIFSTTCRAAIAKDGPPTLDGITSLYEMFSSSVAKYGDNNCIGHRGPDGAYVWLTYKETAARSADIASAMAAVGVGPHGRAGVYGANCPDWMIAMQACNRMTIYCVPLYDSLGENAIEYILHHSESTIVFTQSEKFGMLAKALTHVKDQVKTVVYWGAGDAAAAAATKELGMTVYSFDEFLDLGRSKPADPIPPSAKDLCTIMYTSGTTGDPKVRRKTIKKYQNAPLTK